jgi:hypothetical protein
MKLPLLPIVLALVVPMAACNTTQTAQSPSPGTSPAATSSPATTSTESPAVTNSPTTTESPSTSSGDTSGWSDYSAQSGNYTARFPGKPTEQKQSAQSASGPIEFVLVGYSDNANKRFFGTAESSIPLPAGSSFDVKKGLDGARDNAAKSTNATVTDEKEITQNGYPGREVTMKGQNNLAIIQRMIVNPEGTNPTLYQAIVVAEDGNLTFPEARTFLDSLDIKK